MHDTIAIEVGPGRLARAFLALLAGALLIVPAGAPSPSACRPLRDACAKSAEEPRPRVTVRTRTAGLTTRYLQRELGRDVIPAR